MSHDCESPSAFCQSTRRARKAHRCCECRATIAPGSTYQYISGVWDGRGDSFKTCLLCADMRRLFDRATKIGDRAVLCHLYESIREESRYRRGRQSWDWLRALSTNDASGLAVGHAMGVLYGDALEDEDAIQYQGAAIRQGRLISLSQAREEMGL